MASMFWILTKEKRANSKNEISRYVPFQLNRIQSEIERDLAQNNLVGKPRQGGYTTYFALRRLLLPAATDGGIGCMLVSQNSKYAAEHFMVVRRAYKMFGALDPRDEEKNTLSIALKNNVLHTAYSNRRELVFDYLDSKIQIESAEIEEAGQGVTLHHIVADEYARWPGKPEATLANVRGALVPAGTVDKVSTANGAAGPYYDDVLRAINDPEMSDAAWHFHAWWYLDEFRDALTSEKLDELEKDLTADELCTIAIMKKELGVIAYV